MTTTTALSPGALLASEIAARGWSVAEFCSYCGSDPETVHAVIDGRRAVCPELSRRFGSALGSSPQLWLKLQQRYESWLHYVHAEGAPA